MEHIKAYQGWVLLGPDGEPIAPEESSYPKQVHYGSGQHGVFGISLQEGVPANKN